MNVHSHLFEEEIIGFVSGYSLASTPADDNKDSGKPH